MKSFAIVSGPEAGRTFELGASRIVIGRDDDRDVTIQDDRISRSHLALETRGDSVFAMDMGSSNGTFLNNELIVEREVREGDILMLGATQIRYGAPGGTTEPPRSGHAPPPDDDKSTVIGVAADDSEKATVIGQLPDANSDDETSVMAPPREPTTLAMEPGEGLGIRDGEPWERGFDALPEQLHDVGEAARRLGEEAGMDRRKAHELSLAAREVCANILRFGVPSLGGRIRMRAEIEAGSLVLRISNQGRIFDPAKAPGRPDVQGESFLARGVADQIEYRREDDANVTVMSFRVEPAGG